jgi:hypothetical protein
MTLPFGVRVKLDSGGRRMEVMEPAVS